MFLWLKHVSYKLVLEPCLSETKYKKGKYLNSNLCALVTRNPCNQRLDQDSKIEQHVSMYMYVSMKKLIVLYYVR
ncbi:hypothetical protein Hanom_Chr17g01558041 [Helianthus anomalus]